MTTDPKDTAADQLGPLPDGAGYIDRGEPYSGDQEPGARYTSDQLRAERERCYALGVAKERERCAQYLRDAADRLTPEGKRANQVDRHVAHVLACKGDEIALGAHVKQ